jgi:hypothetical protein
MRGGVNMGRAVETQPMQGDRCFLVVARQHVRRHVDLLQKTSSFASLSLLDMLELALSHFHC